MRSSCALSVVFSGAPTEIRKISDELEKQLCVEFPSKRDQILNLVDELSDDTWQTILRSLRGTLPPGKNSHNELCNPDLDARCIGLIQWNLTMFNADRANHLERLRCILNTDLLEVEFDKFKKKITDFTNLLVAQMRNEYPASIHLEDVILNYKKEMQDVVDNVRSKPNVRRIISNEMLEQILNSYYDTFCWNRHEAKLRSLLAS